MAFTTVRVGHILPALNFRSEKEPLVKLGLFSNKLMIMWALLAVTTLLVGTNLSLIQQSLKITNPNLRDWTLVVSIFFAATFWIELKKTLQYKAKKKTLLPEK